MARPEGRAILLSLRGLKPPAPSRISDLQLEYKHLAPTLPETFGLPMRNSMALELFCLPSRANPLFVVTSVINSLRPVQHRQRVLLLLSKLQQRPLLGARSERGLNQGTAFHANNASNIQNCLALNLRNHAEAFRTGNHLGRLAPVFMILVPNRDRFQTICRTREYSAAQRQLLHNPQQ